MRSSTNEGKGEGWCCGVSREESGAGEVGRGGRRMRARGNFAEEVEQIEENKERMRRE